MEFRILGPLEVIHAGETVHVGGPRERIILAMLLLEAGQVIPVDRLIDAVWDENPPATARGQVQICISNLRRRLISVGGVDLIRTRSPGYLIKLGESDLDLRVFERRVAEARSVDEPQEAARALRSALSLWRGPALSGLDSRLLASLVNRLNERRLAIHGECLDLELSAGKHAELIGELVELVERHPLQEHFRALLMIALYRSGRQAEALEVYRQAREVLVDEFGIDPSEELRQLHQAMLSGEFAVRLPTQPEPAETIAQPTAPAADTIPDGIRCPSLLPAAIPDFTGRAGVVDAIRGQLDEAAGNPDTTQAVRVVVVVGQGGAGKTTLAVHVAHLLAPGFPDGQLFARLRDGDRPVNPSDILERFLRALGISGAALPDGAEERAERFRDLVAGRRILIVLDDAMSEQQVLPLLPGNPRCSVIVTSRRRLTGLPSISRIEIGALSTANAVQLLARITGADRIEAEPAVAAELCRLCGNLPLALRIVGARLAARPHWRVTDLVVRLVDESRRLDELNHGEMGVRASISLTYKGLSADAQVLLRRLALLESPSFSAWVGAPLMEMDYLRAQDLLEELTEAYLIDIEPGQVAGQTRYRFHDIIRPFARERSVEESAEERRAALERWFGALLALSSAAHQREYGGDFLAQHSGASRWPLPDAVVDRLLAEPLAWFEQERSTIVAAVGQAAASGMVEHAWDLALNAVTLFESRSYVNDWRETHERALAAACRHGDRRGEAAMRYSLGSLYMFNRQAQPAVTQLSQAYALYEQLADQHGMALVLRNLAYLDRMKGDLESAQKRWTDALATFRRFADRIGEAHVLHNMAQIHLDLDEQDTARELLMRAAEICAELGNRRVGAQVRHRLGELFLRQGDFPAAAAAYREALEAVRAVGDQVGECYALIGLATADLRQGELTIAARRLGRADELAVAAGDRMAEGRVAQALAELALAGKDLSTAATKADYAISVFTEIGASALRAGALHLRGCIYRSNGELSAARTAWQAAIEVLDGLNLDGAVPLYREIQNQLDHLERPDVVNGGVLNGARPGWYCPGPASA